MPVADFELIKHLKKALLPLRSQRFILAFSGGLDSLTLGQALSEVAGDLSIEWSLAHVDHGPTTNIEQRIYRDQAVSATQTWAQRWKIPAHIRVSQTPLAPDEQSLREFRYRELTAVLHEQSAAKIVTAHHLDDLLETRLLRLVRGTGPQGLQAMAASTAHLLRPWLEVSREEIAAFAGSRGLQALDDPSNKNLTHLRNWVRHQWLPQLEAKQPGAKQALARSLANLTDAVSAIETSNETFGGQPSQIWDRRRFKDLSALDRKIVIARKLRDLGARDFSQSHVEEILKRLDTVQKRLEFTVVGITWQLNAQQISCAHA